MKRYYSTHMNQASGNGFYSRIHTGNNPFKTWIGRQQAESIWTSHLEMLSESAMGSSLESQREASRTEWLEKLTKQKGAGHRKTTRVRQESQREASRTERLENSLNKRGRDVSYSSAKVKQTRSPSTRWWALTRNIHLEKGQRTRSFLQVFHNFSSAKPGIQLACIACRKLIVEFRLQLSSD